MADLIFVAVTIAFFALAVGLVKVCDHIIGPDDESELVVDRTTEREAVTP
jgi:hypothetical protein